LLRADSIVCEQLLVDSLPSEDDRPSDSLSLLAALQLAVHAVHFVAKPFVLAPSASAPAANKLHAGRCNSLVPGDMHTLIPHKAA
jgi:hypothetical protein